MAAERDPPAPVGPRRFEGPGDLEHVATCLPPHQQVLAPGDDVVTAGAGCDPGASPPLGKDRVGTAATAHDDVVTACREPLAAVRADQGGAAARDLGGDGDPGEVRHRALDGVARGAAPPHER